MTKEENEKRLSYLKGIVARLPEKPGSYQFYDDEHTIIYVGKAKSLKARVSSYFHTEVDRFAERRQDLPQHLRHQRTLPAYFQDTYNQ